MLLIDGQVGDYAFSLPMVVIILLLSSWFLSMYVTPAMCYWFMQVKAPPEAGGADADPSAADDPYAGRLYGIYRTLLARMLKLRLIVVAGAVAAIFFGGFVASQLVREFFGPSDRNQFLVYIDLPAGYGIEATDATVRRLNTWLTDKKENPEIKSTIAYVGTGGPRFFLVLAPVQPNAHVAFMVVDTEAGDQVVPVMQRLRSHFAAHFPEASLRAKQMWMGSEEPGSVEIRLIGLDREYLFAKGRALTAALQALPGALDVYNDWENMLFNTRIQVDQVRARRAGVTSREVARSLQSHMDGITITDYREADTAIPVVARSYAGERGDLEDLWNVVVKSARTDEMIPLPQIADIQPYWDFFRVNRRNQERCLTVEFKHENLRAPELLEAARPLIEALDLAPGYRWEVGGELEASVETLGKMKAWMPLCVFGIVVLLIWQFKSFRRPVIIFITIPLAFTGAFIGLLLMRAAFDFFAILGLLSLAGVIINNGIVLIDKIDSERAAGNDDNAVVDAAISRFRPILMTTVTTVLGLMPLIISNDPLFFSMAIVIASGLILGTVLTLGVVPVLYAVFMRV
jgi:multidrug efflux pump subunit AcrB